MSYFVRWNNVYSPIYPHFLLPVTLLNFSPKFLLLRLQIYDKMNMRGEDILTHILAIAVPLEYAGD